jgi:hypothetical protein
MAESYEILKCNQNISMDCRGSPKISFEQGLA